MPVHITLQLCLKVLANSSRYRNLFTWTDEFIDFEQHCRLGNYITSGMCTSVGYRYIISLRAKLSGAVYCYRSCLCVWNGRAGERAACVCYHDNSKLRASILTILGLWVMVVTISSWLNFGRPAPPGRGSATWRKFLAPPYYSQRAVFASLWARFSFLLQAG